MVRKCLEGTGLSADIPEIADPRERKTNDWGFGLLQEELMMLLFRKSKIPKDSPIFVWALIALVIIAVAMGLLLLQKLVIEPDEQVKILSVPLH